MSFIPGNAKPADADYQGMFCRVLRIRHKCSLFWFLSQLADREDYPDYGDKEDPASEQNSRETNNVNINSNNNNDEPYFRVTEYTEKAKVGERVELKCEVKNAARKLIRPLQYNWMWIMKSRSMICSNNRVYVVQK